ncbi:MAG TPA: DUF721 domain-containing protein [Gammaproteobacteria bacterium]|nr:DUF721 domain-containing protein [Gammaproteobacteria bacterium]
MPAGKPARIDHLLRARAPRGVNRLWEAAEQQLQLTRRLREVLPENLRPHVRLARLEGPRLVLTTDSPVWAARLRYYAPQLAKHFGRGKSVTARTVQVQIVPASAPPPAARAAPTLSTDSAALLRRTAQDVESPALRAALLRLASRAR